MALQTVLVSDVPSLHNVQENASLSMNSGSLTRGNLKVPLFKFPGFMVIGHRGNGMNVLTSSDSRMRAIKENSLLSFNRASKFPIDFVEFDVQVTKDEYPIIFHDNFIYSEDNNGVVYDKKVTELTLSEFLSYGPQREHRHTGKPLLRLTEEGNILNWDVELDDAFCTLQEAFQQVEPNLGFNIELKFNDSIVYQHDHLIHVLQAILQVVFDYGKDRPIIFSSFLPDAALLVRKLQNTHPVFFLTDGGFEIHNDVRRNSLEEAIKVCLEGGLQGIVSEVKGIFRNPTAVAKIKESKLSLLTYGKLNNVAEAVYIQHLMGIEGVTVDLVGEITEAVDEMINPLEEEEGIVKKGPQFSDKEISFLLKLIPQLIEH